MIKDHFAKLQNGECSTTEIKLTGICLFLAGVVIGMIIAPPKFFTVGSFNGNSGSIDNPGELLKKCCRHKDRMEDQEDCCGSD